MIIKDNFLNEQQLATVNQLIEKDITKHGGRFERYDDEKDHHETDPQRSYKQKKTTILPHFPSPESWHHSFPHIT